MRSPIGASPVIEATGWETPWSGFPSQPLLCSCSPCTLQAGQSNYSGCLFYPFDCCPSALIHREPLQVPFPFHKCASILSLGSLPSSSMKVSAHSTTSSACTGPLLASGPQWGEGTPFMSLGTLSLLANKTKTTDVDSEDRQQKLTRHAGISEQEEDSASYPTLLVTRHFQGSGTQL